MSIMKTTANVISISTHVETRWAEYVEAAERAQGTLSIEDGKRAGNAWRRWLDLYMTDIQREFIGRTK